MCVYHDCSSEAAAMGHCQLSPFLVFTRFKFWNITFKGDSVFHHTLEKTALFEKKKKEKFFLSLTYPTYSPLRSSLLVVDWAWKSFHYQPINLPSLLPTISLFELSCYSDEIRKVSDIVLRTFSPEPQSGFD